jgi:DegV family protein with EDD domain
MTINIVTDSTCDLTAHLVKQHNITVIPMFINFGNQEFRDGMDLSRQEFYERLPHFQPSPTTAVPGIDIFRETYEQLADKGATEILSIHISEKFSGIVNVARQAAVMTRDIPISVFDSRQLSLGMGFEVLTAAKAIANGKSLQEILQKLEEQISRTHVFAALDTLEFLRRSGRMNAAISRLGEILQIKPLLKMYNGNPTAERVRTKKKAFQRLKELVNEAAPLEQLAILHSNALERADLFLGEIKHMLHEQVVFIEEITPILGAHLGPGVIGIACISVKT